MPLAGIQHSAYTVQAPFASSVLAVPTLSIWPILVHLVTSCLTDALQTTSNRFTVRCRNQPAGYRRLISATEARIATIPEASSLGVALSGA